MPYCDTTFLGTNKSFNSSTTAIGSSTSTFLYNGTDEIIFGLEKPNEIPAQVFLVANGVEYDLSNPIGFNESISFRIKVVLNGTLESFSINILNGSCENVCMMTINLNYEGI